MPPKIYDFPWCDDFSAARNYAVSQAVGDYWLWLDADDVIEGENHEKLRKILEAPEADMVFLPYWLSFDAAGTPPDDLPAGTDFPAEPRLSFHRSRT